MCTWLFYSNYQTLVPLSHSVQPSFCICALFLLYSLSPVHRQIDQKCSWLCKSKLCVMIVAINNFWTKELSLVGDLSDRSWVSLVTAPKYGMKWWSGKWNCGGLANCALWSNFYNHWFTWCTGSPFHLMHLCGALVLVHWFWCTGSGVPFHLMHRFPWYTWYTGSDAPVPLVHTVDHWFIWCTSSPGSHDALIPLVHCSLTSQTHFRKRGSGSGLRD